MNYLDRLFVSDPYFVGMILTKPIKGYKKLASTPSLTGVDRW